MKECYIHCTFGLRCSSRTCLMSSVEPCHQPPAEREPLGEDAVPREAPLGPHVAGEIPRVLSAAWFACLPVDSRWFYITLRVCSLDL